MTSPSGGTVTVLDCWARARRWPWPFLSPVRSSRQRIPRSAVAPAELSSTKRQPVAGAEGAADADRVAVEVEGGRDRDLAGAAIEVVGVGAGAERLGAGHRRGDEQRVVVRRVAVGQRAVAEADDRGAGLDVALAGRVGDRDPVAVAVLRDRLGLDLAVEGCRRCRGSGRSRRWRTCRTGSRRRRCRSARRPASGRAGPARPGTGADGRRAPPRLDDRPHGDGAGVAGGDVAEVAGDVPPLSVQVGEPGVEETKPRPAGIVSERLTSRAVEGPSLRTVSV